MLPSLPCAPSTSAGGITSTSPPTLQDSTTNERRAAYQLRRSLGELVSIGGAAGGKGGGGGGGGGGTISNRSIKALTASVNALTKMTQADDIDTSDSDESAPKRMASSEDGSAGSKRSNAGHPALVRPDKKAKK